MPASTHGNTEYKGKTEFVVQTNLNFDIWFGNLYSSTQNSFKASFSVIS